MRSISEEACCGSAGLSAVAGGLIDRGQLEYGRGQFSVRKRRGEFHGRLGVCLANSAPSKNTQHFQVLKRREVRRHLACGQRLACATSAASLRRTSGRKNENGQRQIRQKSGRLPFGRLDCGDTRYLPDVPTGSVARRRRLGKFGSNPLRPVAREAAQVLRHGNLVHEIVVDDPLAPLQLEPIPVMRDPREQSGGSAHSMAAWGQTSASRSPGNRLPPSCARRWRARQDRPRRRCIRRSEIR